MAKKFRFNLEPLLRLRRHEEDLQRRLHGDAKRKVLDQNQVLLDLLKQEDEGKNQFGDLKREASLSIRELRMQEQHLGALGRKIRQEYQVLQGLLVDEANVRRQLTEAAKKVRVLEKLRDRRRASHDYELSRQEMRELDEVGLDIFRAARKEGA